MTIGLYMQELIRHVDPAHRTLGRFFHEEIAKPLGIEFYIGLPPEIPDERLAQLRLFSPMRAIRALPSVPKGYVMRIMWPWSLLRKSMLFADMDPNDRRYARDRDPGGQRRGDGARDRPGLFGVRGRRGGARHHPGDAREPHGGHTSPSARGTR